MTSTTWTGQEPVPRRESPGELQTRNTLTAGGAGLIPPQGVLMGVRTDTYKVREKIVKGFRDRFTNIPRDYTQTLELSVNRSFFIYRENGKQDVDYVVIRVFQALVGPGVPMFNESRARGYWPYEVRIDCSHDRIGELIGSSPDSTLGPSLITQLSQPLQVKYLRDGSCVPQVWPATHGPVAHSSAGWGVLNQSSVGTSKAEWLHFHREPWNTQADPPAAFQGRWWPMMYEGGVADGRVKHLNPQARSTFTFENVAAWRFKASDLAINTQVAFRERLTLYLALFINKTLTYEERHEIHTRSLDYGGPDLILDLRQETEDVTSPCL